jgi:hypothetical protein
MTTIVSDRGRIPRHWPRAWMERIERSIQAQNPISAINSEAIVMRRTIEHPSPKFLLGFVIMAAGILAVLLFLPYAMPQCANPVSANDIAGNVFNAKRVCMSVENPSAEFA